MTLDFSSGRLVSGTGKAFFANPFKGALVHLKEPLLICVDLYSSFRKKDNPDN